MLSQSHPIKLFGLGNTQNFARKIARHLGISPTFHIEKVFEDDECYVKPTNGASGNVRGHEVFVVHSLYSDEKERVADKFMKLCIMCGALKQANAYKVIPVIPYLAWARQDRKTESRAPITTKIIANMLEATGISSALFMDVHNLSAVQNAFSVPVDNLESKNLHAQTCADLLNQRNENRKIAIMSPDAGGMARANRFRNALTKIMGIQNHEIDVVVFDKTRDPKTGQLFGGRITGDVQNTDVIMVDDIISTAGTIVKAASVVPQFGGTMFAICATHGLFVGDANNKLNDITCPIIISNTVDPWRVSKANQSKIQIVDTSKMFADAIYRIHTQTGSISELLEV